MRIGIDATCWANARGYGRFTRELITAMAPLAPAHEFVCFLDERAAGRFDLAGPNITRIVVPQSESPTMAASSGTNRAPMDMLRLTRAVHRARCDAFFSPAVYSYFPLPPGLPAIVTVHDAIAERFPALTLPTWRDRWAWRAKVQLALWQARGVLAVSDYAADQIARYLGVAPSRMRVCLEGVASVYAQHTSATDVHSAAARAGVPEGARWLMYVGGFGPHKHVGVLVRAHAAVAKRRVDASPLVLLLAGETADGFHQDVDRIRHAIHSCGTEPLVRWTGYLPDDELRALYAGAVALVLPSASEGFGLPAVEAARCGTPVIATRESPLPQLLEGGGLFVPPGDAGAIDAAIERLLDDEPARIAMGARARESASALSWSRSASIALQFIERVARQTAGR